MRTALIQSVFLFLIITYAYSESAHMEIKFYPRRATTPVSKWLDSRSIGTRGEGNMSYFLVFFSNGTGTCKMGYINIAAPRGQMLKNGIFNDIVGEDSSSRTKALLSFYYTEPRGSRFHCFDNNQVGDFNISIIEFDNYWQLKNITFTFNVYCVINGQTQKNGASGSVYWNSGYGSMKMNEDQSTTPPTEERLKFLS